MSNKNSCVILYLCKNNTNKKGMIFMEKTLKMIIDGEKMTFEPSTNLTNVDSLVMAINLFEVTKDNMEKELTPDTKPTLEEFISVVIKSLRNKEQEESKDGKK